MQVSALRIGQKIQGPSGAVYQVTKILPQSVMVVCAAYTQDPNSGWFSMELDQVALERFKPYEGDDK